MNRIGLTLFAVVVVFVLAPGIAQAQSLQGTWQMEEITGSEYANTRVNPQGLWILGPRYYSYLLIEGTEERQRLAPLQTPGQPTEAERLAFAAHVGPFLRAQTGTYEVQGTTLIYHPIIGRIEGSNGYQEVRQELEFEDDNTLWLIASGGARRKFIRIE